jgi:hypothetical protein
MGFVSRKSLTLLIGAALACAAPTISRAQQPATIQGTVRDAGTNERQPASTSRRCTSRLPMDTPTLSSACSKPVPMIRRQRHSDPRHTNAGEVVTVAVAAGDEGSVSFCRSNIGFVVHIQDRTRVSAAQQHSNRPKRAVRAFKLRSLPARQSTSLEFDSRTVKTRLSRSCGESHP